MLHTYIQMAWLLKYYETVLPLVVEEKCIGLNCWDLACRRDCGRNILFIEWYVKNLMNDEKHVDWTDDFRFFLYYYCIKKSKNCCVQYGAVYIQRFLCHSPHSKLLHQRIWVISLTLFLSSGGQMLWYLLISLRVSSGPLNCSIQNYC